MAALDDLADIVKRQEPLAPYTYLKLGGPAEMLVQPRSRAELADVVRRCFAEQIPLRVLGGGCHVLVRDEGVRGVVLRLSAPAFTEVRVEGKRVQTGTGAPMSALISQAAQHGLAGLETLVGIPGTVGGALRCNAGDRSGDIGQFVRRVEVLDAAGTVQVRERDELQFMQHGSNLDDPVILSAEFELDTDDAAAIVKRMRKAWILRKAGQPLSFQAAGRIFKNPRGLSAAALIEQAGLARTRVGGAEVSERDACFIVVHAGATARDVLRLIDLVRSRVQERFSVDLELEITVWWDKPMRRIARALAPLLGAVLFLGGLGAVGKATRDWLRQQQRTSVAFSAIDCVPPPGEERAQFLDEVQYGANLPDRLGLLDDDLTSHLAEAFARHPWVEKVERVVVTPRQIRVELRYRTAVLAVPLGAQMRAVDGHGILLPPHASTVGLPLLRGAVKPPTGVSGTVWEDAAVQDAAATVAYVQQQTSLRPSTVQVLPERRLLLETTQGKRVWWGRPPGAEINGEPAAARKVERLRQVAERAGDVHLDIP